MTYSLDLRKKALDYLKKGHSREETSLIFGVAPQTLSDWRRKEKEGNLAPKSRVANPYKLDNENLKKYINENPDAYLHEIASQFNVTTPAIFYACKRMRITLKKRQLSTKKGMKKKESCSEKI